MKTRQFSLITTSLGFIIAMGPVRPMAHTSTSSHRERQVTYLQAKVAKGSKRTEQREAS